MLNTVLIFFHKVKYYQLYFVLNIILKNHDAIKLGSIRIEFWHILNLFTNSENIYEQHLLPSIIFEFFKWI